MRHLIVLLLAIWGSAVLWGCTVEFDDTCAGDDDCPADQVCDEQYCVPGARTPDSMPPMPDLELPPDMGAVDAEIPDALPFPVPGAPGGPCENNADCPLGTLCSPELGICGVECSDSPNICGEFARCGSFTGGDLRICRMKCDRRERWSCWPGWSCEPDPDGQGDVCLPACWHPLFTGCTSLETCGPNFSYFNRCTETQTCDLTSGRCLEANELGRCPLPCQPGERCRELAESGGRCIRDDGSCTSNYNCGQQRPLCHLGRCIPPQSTISCAPGADVCPEGMACGARSPENLDGRCQPECGSDEDCPPGNTCKTVYPDEPPVCIESFCGDENGNGDIFGECAIAGEGEEINGTCYWLGVEGSGLCSAAGTAQIGDQCDNQFNILNPSTAPLQCAPGLICVGDNDNPEIPRRPLPGLGRCLQYCDTLLNSCPEGFQCLTLDNSSEGAQGQVSGRSGVCSPSTCTVGLEEAATTLECGQEGQTCVPVSLFSDEGVCLPERGDALPLFTAPCALNEECPHGGVCVDPGLGVPICLPTCNPNNQRSRACNPNERCLRDIIPGFGVCLPN
ncbi:MAG: hypothetical protein ACE366_19910 [Bradymonadia bacterium]